MYFTRTLSDRHVTYINDLVKRACKKQLPRHVLTTHLHIPVRVTVRMGSRVAAVRVAMALGEKHEAKQIHRQPHAANNQHQLGLRHLLLCV